MYFSLFTQSVLGIASKLLSYWIRKLHYFFSFLLLDKSAVLPVSRMYLTSEWRRAAFWAMLCINIVLVFMYQQNLVFSYIGKWSCIEFHVTVRTPSGYLVAMKWYLQLLHSSCPLLCNAVFLSVEKLWVEILRSIFSAVCSVFMELILTRQCIIYRVLGLISGLCPWNRHTDN